MMITETAPSLADRFARFIERLCAVIGVYAAVFPWARPEVAAAVARVQRLGERFALLAARASTGTLRPRRSGAARRPDTARPRPPIPAPTARWLMQAVAAAVHCAEPFNRLLADPEMARLVAAAPQAGRILRPLCRMLRVKRPGYLRPSRRPGHARPPQAVISPADADPPCEPAALPVLPSASRAEGAPATPARLPPGGLYWDGVGFRWA
jgi:hypothetical protein